jgi:hypothetical protein
MEGRAEGKPGAEVALVTLEMSAGVVRLFLPLGKAFLIKAQYNCAIAKCNVASKHRGAKRKFEEPKRFYSITTTSP